ncbi:MAG: hypothetical protein WC509_05880 [Candidatus Izemoplasmatales bacterium]
MKKTLLLLLAFLFAGSLTACERTLPDYTADEAFDLMNEAISRWLSAESFTLDYASTYVAGSVETTESMTVRLKHGGADDLIAYVATTIEEPDRWQNSETQYEDGRVYVARNENGTVTRTWSTTPRAEFESLYRSFLKDEINEADTRADSFVVDADQCTVQFEFDATMIESTFHVPADIDSVRFATVAVTFTHDADLLALEVSYGTTADDVDGTVSYTVAFDKIDRYLVIARLSASEKAAYTESADAAE